MRRTKSASVQRGARGPMAADSRRESMWEWSEGLGAGGWGLDGSAARSAVALSAKERAAAEEGRIINCPGGCLAARWSVQRLPRQAVVGGKILRGRLFGDPSTGQHTVLRIGQGGVKVNRIWAC